MRSLAAALVLALPLSALARDKSAAKGVPVEIQVVDTEGEPVPTAILRHEDERVRHTVSDYNGTWEGRALYLPDGSELHFGEGMQLDLWVTAAGYQPEHIRYEVRKRKNRVRVVLDVIPPDQPMEEPMVLFLRDKPKQDLTEAPAH